MGRRKREEGEGGGRPAIDTSTRAGSALSNGIFGLVASLETENNGGVDAQGLAHFLVVSLDFWGHRLAVCE